MSKTRKVERQIEIEASAETVWKALTDATELMRWFPLDARSKPEPGGSIWYSWGPPYEGESRIAIWEPPHHLKLENDWAHGPSEEGKEPGSVTQQLAMEFTLESEGGKTVLRLVHSGFNVGAEWDDEFEGTSRGWDQEFLGLKHYLERHAGQDRKSVWARRKIELPTEKVWQRLIGNEGLNIDGLKQGDSFDRMSSSKERLQGRIVLLRPPRDFCAVLENWNDAFFRLSVEQSGKPRRHAEPQLWLSTYNLMNHQVMNFQTSWTKLLISLFPEEFKE